MSNNSKNNDILEDSLNDEIRRYFDNLGKPKDITHPIEYNGKMYNKIQNTNPLILIRSNALCGCCEVNCHYVIYYQIVKEELNDSDILPIIGISQHNCHCTDCYRIHIMDLSEEEYPVCIDQDISDF